MQPYLHEVNHWAGKMARESDHCHAVCTAEDRAMGAHRRGKDSAVAERELGGPLGARDV